MNEPEWVLRETALILHKLSLDEHGGKTGLREPGMLDSALGKPQNLWAYGSPSLFALAASYAFGVIKNHPFIDGNKRTGFVASVTFLELNGFRFQATETDAASRTLALAAGEMSEEAYSIWMKNNSALP